MKRNLLLEMYRASILVIVLVVCTSFQVSASPMTTPLNQQINDYFVNLRDSFDKIASNSAVTTTSLARTDRYFVGVLKKQQTFCSLIRTNSKGVVTNEVIRGQTPERNYRSIAYQRWFKQVQQTGKDYFGFLKESTGRYYLFWSKPVFKTRRSGSQTFVGAVAVKIDIWDAVHEFSQSVDVPFLVSLNKMSLYSHKWQKPDQFETEGLTVPGVENVSVSFIKQQKHQTAAVQDENVGDAAQLPEEQKATVANDSIQNPKAASSTKGMMTVLGIIALLLIVGVAVGIRVFMGIRQRSLLKKIDSDNSLF